MKSFHWPNSSQHGEAAVTTHPPLPNTALTQTNGHFSVSKPTQCHQSYLFNILCTTAQTHSPFSLCLLVVKYPQNHAPSDIFIRGLLSSASKTRTVGKRGGQPQQNSVQRGGRAHTSRETFGREGGCENTMTLTRPNGHLCGTEKQMLGVVRLPFSEILSEFPWIYY